MDQENLQLQRLLHEQSQKRLDRLEDLQRKHGELLTRIVTNTDALPELVSRVDDLESSRDKERGVLGLIGVGWAGLEAFFHWHK